MGKDASHRIIVVLEERFSLSISGKVYSRVFGPDFWSRYLDVFDDIYVIARMERSDEEFSSRHCIDDPRIKFVASPYYKGMLGFLKAFPNVIVFLVKASLMKGFFIMRLPGMMSSLLLPFLMVFRRDYAVELVGDPDAVFSSGGVGGVFAPLLRVFFVASTKLACYTARGVSYVTESTMQRKYPASPRAFRSSFSSVDIASSSIVSHREIRDFVENSDPTILMAGSMEQMYKGFDLFIDILPDLLVLFPGAKAVILGDGRYRQSLVHRAEVLGVSGAVSFPGAVSRDKVFEYMDYADIFVIPSRTEGLPRVLIEAFSRGLPAVGSDAGGIPELLPSELCFPVGDREALKDLLLEVINDACMRRTMSLDNVSKAAEYTDDVLRKRRIEFYSRLRDNGKRA